MSEGVITVESMRDKLHPLDHVREALARTEPLSTHPFTVGDDVRFVVESGWRHGLDAKQGTEPVRAAIQLGRGSGAREWQLTKDTVLEAANASGLRRTFAANSPSEIIESHLNFWFREGFGAHGFNRDFQLLAAAGIGSAITRASIVPFSNLSLLDQLLAGIENKYGRGEVLVDPKFTHSLRRTHLRLIVPEQRRTIRDTGMVDDDWSVGLQLKNSIVGGEKTSVDGYLFRWVCTNGAIDTHLTSGVWSRRGSGGEDEEGVYEWARSAVDEILGGLEPALDRVQEMVRIPIEGHANDVLRDLFERYRTPVADRTKIIENMVDSEQLTMYAVMNAITQCANASDLDAPRVEALLRMGGDLPYAAHARCGECYRMLPD